LRINLLEFFLRHGNNTTGMIKEDGLELVVPWSRARIYFSGMQNFETKDTQFHSRRKD
jgi:hypothetical protein